MIEPMLDPDKLDCHRTAFKKTCKKHRDKCGLWMKMTRTDPRTGETLDQWMCGDIWRVILDTEIIHRLDGVQAATESFRNEMVRQNDETVRQNQAVADELLRLSGGSNARLING